MNSVGFSPLGAAPGATLSAETIATSAMKRPLRLSAFRPVSRMAFGTMRVALRALLLALPFVAVIAALTSVGTVGRVAVRPLLLLTLLAVALVAAFTAPAVLAAIRLDRGRRCEAAAAVG